MVACDVRRWRSCASKDHPGPGGAVCAQPRGDLAAVRGNLRRRRGLGESRAHRGVLAAYPAAEPAALDVRGACAMGDRLSDASDAKLTRISRTRRQERDKPRHIRTPVPDKNQLSAARASAEGFRYDRVQRSRQTEQLIAAFPIAPKAIEAQTRPTPIFIVGMPSSATALVENTLCGHAH